MEAKFVCNLKWLKKWSQTTKCCLSPISAINRFGVYAASEILGEQTQLTPSKFIAPK